MLPGLGQAPGLRGLAAPAALGDSGAERGDSSRTRLLHPGGSFPRPAWFSSSPAAALPPPALPALAPLLISGAARASSSVPTGTPTVSLTSSATPTTAPVALAAAGGGGGGATTAAQFVATLGGITTLSLASLVLALVLMAVAYLLRRAHTAAGRAASLAGGGGRGDSGTSSASKVVRADNPMRSRRSPSAAVNFEAAKKALESGKAGPQAAARARAALHERTATLGPLHPETLAAAGLLADILIASEAGGAEEAAWEALVGCVKLTDATRSAEHLEGVALAQLRLMRLFEDIGVSAATLARCGNLCHIMSARGFSREAVDMWHMLVRDGRERAGSRPWGGGIRKVELAADSAAAASAAAAQRSRSASAKQKMGAGSGKKAAASSDGEGSGVGAAAAAASSTRRATSNDVKAAATASAALEKEEGGRGAPASSACTPPFALAGTWTQALCTGYEEVEGAPQWRIVPAVSGQLTLTLTQDSRSPSASVALVPAHPRGAKASGHPSGFAVFSRCSSLTLPVQAGQAYTLIVATYHSGLRDDETALDWELTGSLPLREPPAPLTLQLRSLLNADAEAAEAAEQARRAAFLARMQAAAPGTTAREAWEDYQVASARVEAARAECRARGGAFEDGWSGTPAAIGEGWDKGAQAVWARFEQCAPHPVVFEGGFGLRDVKQGGLGDCYLIAAMADLAGCLGERLEDALDTLFVTGEANAEGVYCVRLWVEERWQHILLDDRLPCRPDSFVRPGEPEKLRSGAPDPAQGRFFSLLAAHSSTLNAMWPCLLEKAWAKMHGSYSSIAASSFNMMDSKLFPLNCFLPHSLKRFQEHLPLPSGSSSEGGLSKDELWEKLKLWSAKGWPMTTGSRDAEAAGAGGSQGVSRKHAYSIMRLLGPPGSPEDERLIQLRDPWGEGGWHGRFGYRDESAWTPALQAAAGYDLKGSSDSGIFWISLQDFLFQYSGVNVVRNILLARDGGGWRKAEVKGAFLGEHLRSSAAKEDWLDKDLQFPQFLIHGGDDNQEFTVSLELETDQLDKLGALPFSVKMGIFSYKEGTGVIPIKAGDHWHAFHSSATVKHLRGLRSSAGSFSLTQEAPTGCSLVVIPTLTDMCGCESVSYTLCVLSEASFTCRRAMPGADSSTEEGVKWVSQ